MSKRQEKHAAKWQAGKKKTADWWEKERAKHEDPHGGLQSVQPKPEDKK